MKYVDEYRSNEAASYLVNEIIKNANILAREKRTINIMEVCGSHTMAISKYGIRRLLPNNINLISGPGCPVCVTDAGYIDTAIELSKRGLILVSFGDMINVPGSNKGTLAKSRAEGNKVEVCYSPVSAIQLAKTNIDSEIVFLAIGFETTIAPVLSMLDTVIKQNIENISMLTAFKIVPPILDVLTSDPELKIDAYLCPAHVSAVIGAKAYEPIVKKYNIPCVIASFEPVEILLGINSILKQIVNGLAKVENNYERVVTYDGNMKAQNLLNNYLERDDATWRGIGLISNSGLKFKQDFSKFDITRKFNIEFKTVAPENGCRCGDILKGKIRPPDCQLYSNICTPINPIGPCMVSSEGTCAAYYKYV